MAWTTALSDLTKDTTEQRIRAHAAKVMPGKADQIRVRFRGDYCYIDAEEQPGEEPIHLCRLQWTGDPEAWSLSFFTYSGMKYEPCFFPSGEPAGTPEDAFDVGAMYL